MTSESFTLDEIKEKLNPDLFPGVKNSSGAIPIIHVQPREITLSVETDFEEEISDSMTVLQTQAYEFEYANQNNLLAALRNYPELMKDEHIKLAVITIENAEAAIHTRIRKIVDSY